MVLIVMTTVPNAVEADSLAAGIVAKGLAACVQILPQMKSIYLWEGSVQTDSEQLLLIKTLQKNFDGLSNFIEANHSYAVPEIIAIDAEQVSGQYLAWMNDSIG